MIHDSSSMDSPVDPARRSSRRNLVAVAIVLALLLAAAAFYPSIRRWMQSEVSIEISRVRLGEVTRGDLTRDVAADGRVVAAFHPTLFSPASGIVAASVLAGEVVTRGQAVAHVDSPELASLLQQERATLNALQSDHGRLRLDTCQRDLDNEQAVELLGVRAAAAARALRRTEKLFGLGLVNEIDLESARDELTIRNLELAQAEQKVGLEREMLAFELADARQRLDRHRLVVEELERQVEALTVRSPVSGLVSRLHIEDREAVSESTPLVTVVDLSSFEIEIAVPESYAEQIAPGTRAIVTFGGGDCAGEVTRMSPEVQGSRVQGTVVFSGAQPSGLKQNQRVSVRLVMETRRAVLKVPRGPFLDDGGGRQAYVVEDGLAVLRPIEVGALSIGEVEIVSGLAVGDRIILSDTSRFKGASTILLRR